MASMKFTALAIVMLFSVAQAALANDTTAELKTGGLVFVQTDAISMVEEKLHISPSEVRSSTSSATSPTEMSRRWWPSRFPTLRAATTGWSRLTPMQADNFLGFEASQDGVPIDAELPQQQAVVHDVDLSAELKAENIPLMPGAEATAAALSRLGPQAVERFQGLASSASSNGMTGQRHEGKLSCRCGR